MPANSLLRIAFLSDTHLGFDYPVRSENHQGRRGKDFFDNFELALQISVDRSADLIIHGGDFFFRSKISNKIEQMAFSMLSRFMRHRIPFLIIPGNHERSRLPLSLLLQHPDLHVFSAPESIRLKIRNLSLRIDGIPFIGNGVRDKFSGIIAAFKQDQVKADFNLLCLHESIEGAQVGPSNFTFRYGPDVIRACDLPDGYDCILAGHIHRSQVLAHQSGDRLIPVIYAGSIERTSFAEKNEQKGFYLLELEQEKLPSLKYEFSPLPAREMISLDLNSSDPVDLKSRFKQMFESLPCRSIVRISCENIPDSGIIKEAAPDQMIIQLNRKIYYKKGIQSDGCVLPESEKLPALPELPGVYIFYGNTDKIIYIGKSVNLKNRVRSYFSTPRDKTVAQKKKIKVSRIETITVECELEALLLEDSLIKKHRPLYNIKQKNCSEYVYLAMTCGSFPCLRIIGLNDAGNYAEYFGPFKDRFLAEQIREICSANLKFRNCVSDVPANRCFYYGIGKCSGPCFQKISREQYQEISSQATDFLNGSSGLIRSRIEERMQAHSEKQEFELAEKLKQLSEFCERFCQAQVFIRNFRQQNLEIRFADFSLLFEHGRFTGRRNDSEAKSLQAEDPRFMLERALIVKNWVTAHKDLCTCIFSG
ncbi:MAG: metallophosphoesterase [Candidatus Wallbacteria bacterium]|nr:metallophosphoesterase [Candidatus Wallbacteria bacterium]